MYSKLRFFYICFLFYGVSFSGYAVDKERVEATELQVLIDVSGSMKKNDPNNLRIPAIKLLINLLPEGVRVGLWLFAEETKQLVETGVVNKKWRKKALAKVKTIHSRGLLTNIEDAIQQASQQWFQSERQQKRYFILLTDGVVDISKDIMQSAESRDNIISKQIPLLQQSGVQVHTIALSDEADTELLDKLASDTNGWFETAQSAEQLQKVFFKTFKQAIKLDTVPIVGNTFLIDTTVKEFSVLIFKQLGAKATQLITPDKTKINASSKEKSVSWLNEKSYDLVTIKQPKEGEWKIQAKMDPENEVMVITDLKLVVEGVPNQLSIKEMFDLRGFFTDQKVLVSRKVFLDLIDISVYLDEDKKLKMSPVSGRAGLFSQKIEGLKKGRHTLKIVADGKTFKREFIKTIEVKDSYISVEKDIKLAERTVKITLSPDITMIDAEKMTVEAKISQIGQTTRVKMLDKKGGQWLLDIKKTELGVRKVINFSIMANTVKGEIISPQISPIIIDDRLFDMKVDDEKLVQPKIELIQDVIATDTENSDLDAEELVDEEELVNWQETAGIVVGVNVLLIGLVFFGYKFMKKKSVIEQEKLLSRLSG